MSRVDARLELERFVSSVLAARLLANRCSWLCRFAKSRGLPQASRAVEYILDRIGASGGGVYKVWITPMNELALPLPHLN